MHFGWAFHRLTEMLARVGHTVSMNEALEDTVILQEDHEDQCHPPKLSANASYAAEKLDSNTGLNSHKKQ